MLRYVEPAAGSKDRLPAPTEMDSQEPMDDSFVDDSNMAAELRSADVNVRKELQFVDESQVNFQDDGEARMFLKRCNAFLCEDHKDDKDFLDSIATPQKKMRKEMAHWSPDEQPFPEIVEAAANYVKEPSSHEDPLGGESQPLPEPLGEPVPTSPKQEPAAESAPAAPEQAVPASVLVHRKNSAAWHAKWISKGVPRVPKNNNNEAPVAPAPVEPVAPVNEASGPIVSLAKARDKFITQWISECGMPPSNERRRAACAAWMASPLRAQLMAARTGTQA